jgi:polyhydroxyalkanoate synthesis regulator phasin
LAIPCHLLRIIFFIPGKTDKKNMREGVGMLDLLLSLGWGTISMTWEKAEQLVQKLVFKGDIKKEDAKKMINLLVERGEKERQEFKEYVSKEVARILQINNTVTRGEFSALQERVNNLEKTEPEE